MKDAMAGRVRELEMQRARARRDATQVGSRTYYGRIVSTGPNGEADLAGKNRYWVQVGDVSNTDADATSAVTLAGLSASLTATQVHRLSSRLTSGR